MTSPGNRLWVVNDDATQLRLMERVLTRFGYDVQTFLDASAALEALQDAPHVDLFIIDLHMPGIDGWKLCRLLRSPDYARWNDVPVLVVSATFSGADVEAITTDIGADAFLPLPFSREDLLEFVSGLLAGEKPRPRSRVLVIDDDDAVRASIVRLFQAHGYQVFAARDGAEANSLWARHGADVVLLDYHLPDVRCEDLLKRFQRPADPTVVLIMTGDTDPTLPVRLMNAGADGYVRKPFEPEFLIELARKAQRERSLLRVEAILEQRTRELRASEQRFRGLFEAIPDLVFVLDPRDRVVQVNHEVPRALGRSMASLEGISFFDLLAPHAARAAIAAVDDLRAAGGGAFETVLMRADGTAMTVEISGVMSQEISGSSLLLVARDVTARLEAERERKQLQEQVQHAQRLESLGVLAGGIAHDFNNLLVGILGNAGLIVGNEQTDATVAHCARQIQAAAVRAAELTDQILAFAGKGKSVKAPVDLSALVEELGPLIEPAISKKANLVYRLAPDLPPVDADAGQLRQVAMNLIINASEALQGRTGTIHVETKVTELDRDDLRRCTVAEHAVPGSFVELTVEDDGCGMDERTLRQIFDPFFTTKFTGRGLGLAATLGIVRTHRGFIRVDSAPGRGTRFSVFLPPARRGPGPRRADADDERHAPPATEWSATGTALVVDDEPSVRSLAGAALRRLGFQVDEAADGAEAIEKVSHTAYSVVLLDLTMPGMDGLETLERLRSSHPDLPILLSSGYTEDSVPRELMRTGPTAFLRKPYGPTQLNEAVAQLMMRKLRGAPLLRLPGSAESGGR